MEERGTGKRARIENVANLNDSKKILCVKYERHWIVPIHVNSSYIFVIGMSGARAMCKIKFLFTVRATRPNIFLSFSLFRRLRPRKPALRVRSVSFTAQMSSCRGVSHGQKIQNSAWAVQANEIRHQFIKISRWKSVSSAIQEWSFIRAEIVNIFSSVFFACRRLFPFHRIIFILMSSK